jgi:hypothetical protein
MEYTEPTAPGFRLGGISYWLYYHQFLLSSVFIIISFYYQLLILVGIGGVCTSHSPRPRATWNSMPGTAGLPVPVAPAG